MLIDPGAIHSFVSLLFEFKRNESSYSLLPIMAVFTLVDDALPAEKCISLMWYI